MFTEGEEMYLTGMDMLAMNTLLVWQSADPRACQEWEHNHVLGSPGRWSLDLWFKYAVQEGREVTLLP